MSAALPDPTASARRSHIERTTRETRISLDLDLDGGPISISSDVAFLNHMLEAFATHAGCGLRITATGDGMDHHHLVEDIGICLGRAIAEALGDKSSIVRFGSIMLPLDEALIAASVDLSGRSYLHFAVEFPIERLGDLATELILEFFRAVTDHGRFNLHLIPMHGRNAHHLCEAIFKAFARAFAQAKQRTGSNVVPSTKGLLE